VCARSRSCNTLVVETFPSTYFAAFVCQRRIQTDDPLLSLRNEMKRLSFRSTFSSVCCRRCKIYSKKTKTFYDRLVVKHVGCDGFDAHVAAGRNRNCTLLDLTPSSSRRGPKRLGRLALATALVTVTLRNDPGDVLT